MILWDKIKSYLIKKYQKEVVEIEVKKAAVVERKERQLKERSNTGLALWDYVDKPVIYIPKAATNPIIGIATGVDYSCAYSYEDQFGGFSTGDEKPRLIIHNALTGNREIVDGVPYHYQLEILKALMKLDAVTRVMIVHNITAQEVCPCDPHEHLLKYSEIIQKLINCDFFEEIATPTRRL